MKRTIFLTAFLIALFFTTQVNAQCIDGAEIYPIYKTGAQYIQSFEKEEGYEIVRVEYDLVFTSKDTYRDLYSDWTYVIFGFADDGVKDLDLKLYEYDDLLEEWVLVTEDVTSDNIPTIAVTPTVNTMYKVVVSVYEFYEGYTAAHYGLMFMHE